MIRLRHRFESLPTSAAIIIFAIASLCAFGQILWFRFVNLDDARLILGNPFIQSLDWTSLWRLFAHPTFLTYTPVRYVSHMLDIALYGTHPWGHHLTNLLLHFVNAVLLYTLTRQLVAPSDLKRIPHSWFAVFVALFFLLHPASSESVAWVSARKELLALFFFQLALVSQMKSFSHHAFRWTILSLLAFSLACLSKSTPAILAPLFLLMPFLGSNPHTIKKASFGVAHLTLGMSCLILAHALFTHTTHEQVSLSLLTWVSGSISTLMGYLTMLVWPFHLSPTRSLPGPAPAIAQITFVVSALALSIILTRKRLLYGFLITWWLLPLLLPSIFPNLLFLLPARYLYLSLPAFSALVVLLVDRTPLPVLSRNLLIGALLSVNLIGCFVETSKWTATQSLWSAVLRHTPEDEKALSFLASHYLDIGRPEEAFQLITKATRLHPLQPEVAQISAEILRVVGMDPAAEAQLRIGIAHLAPAMRSETIARFHRRTQNSNYKNHFQGTTVDYQSWVWKDKRLPALLLLSNLIQANEASSLIEERMWLAIDYGLAGLARLDYTWLLSNNKIEQPEKPILEAYFQWIVGKRRDARRTVEAVHGGTSSSIEEVIQQKIHERTLRGNPISPPR